MSDFQITLLLIVLLFALTMFGFQMNANRIDRVEQEFYFPKAMRGQNSEPLYLAEGEESILCQFGYEAPGEGITLLETEIYISKKYTGALLTVNVDQPSEIWLHAVGGSVKPDKAFLIGYGLSAVWPIENVWNSYYITLKPDTYDEHSEYIDKIDLCRISVQVNR